MENIIKVISKTFDIIGALDEAKRLTLKEITDKVNLPKPTVYRILNTLQSIGYIEYDSKTLSHSLSHKFVAIAKNYLHQNDLLLISIPYMKKLKEEFGETVNLARLTEKEAIFLHIEQSDHPFRYVDRVGDSAPLHSTAIGKAILAFQEEEKLNQIIENYKFYVYTKRTITNFQSLKENLKKTREAGFSLDEEEGHDGVICIGIPIFNKDHLPFAALSISMPKVRANKKIIERIGNELQKIGVQISLKLGVYDIRKCYSLTK